MDSLSFPVVKSLASGPELAPLLEAAYGLHDVRCQLIQATMRDVYRVDTAQRPYALFIYRHAQRTPEEITAEWRFIEFLHTKGAPVAPAVRRQNGELLLTLTAPEGIRYGVLSEFVEGRHLRHRYSVEAVQRYGRAIAQIHTLADVYPIDLTRPHNDYGFIVEQSLDALAPLLTHRLPTLNYLREVAERIKPRFNELPAIKPYYGTIHGDVIRANAQIADNGEVTVLDFDLCGPGWRAYDVASYLEVAETDEAKAAFLRGYQEIRELSAGELALLPIFEATRHIFSIGIPAQNIDHWGRASLTDTMIDASIEGLKRCMAAGA